MKHQRHYNIKPKNMNGFTEEELQKRLLTTLTAIVIISLVVFGSIFFFGPKVGALFGLFSIHRNEVDVDKMPPNAPTFLNVSEFTKETTMSFKGFSEAGSKVRLFVNGPEVLSVNADKDGKFEFNNIQLINSNNTIFAKAVDLNGNESGKSETINVTVDKQAPKITIENMKDGDILRNLDKRIDIKGLVDEQAVVKINDRFAVLKPDLSFELILGVEEGNIEIKIEAEDKAGNKSEKSITVTYQKKSN